MKAKINKIITTFWVIVAVFGMEILVALILQWKTAANINKVMLQGYSEETIESLKDLTRTSWEAVNCVLAGHVVALACFAACFCALKKNLENRSDN